MSAANRDSTFLIVCLVEIALLVLGGGLVLALRVPVLEWMTWRSTWVLMGLVATLPLLGVLIWLMRTSWAPVTTIRRFVDEVLRPVLGQFSVLQLLLLAIFAGIAEEFFFRAFLQVWISGWLGSVAGLLLSSLVFGACHLVTRFYGLFATILGVYLGGLMLYSGSFWPPAIAHALYDFLALVWLLKIRSVPAALVSSRAWFLS